MLGISSCTQAQQDQPGNQPPYSQPPAYNPQPLNPAPANAPSLNVPPPDAALPPGDAQQASRWPMQATTADGAQVTIFQPQLEDFQGDQLTARAAVSVTPAGQQDPVFGAIWLQSRVETDRVNRTVHIIDVNVTQSKFPGADPVSEPNLAAAVRQVLLANPATLSQDQLLTMLQTVQKAKADAQNLQNTPPNIVFLSHPAMKVQYDGTPRLTQVQGTNLLQAVNTPFFVALDPDTRRYFLKGAGRWFDAADPMGPFQLSRTVPDSVAKLADSNGYKDPAQPISDAQAAALQIVTATDPTELVWADGEPQLSTIPGTDLLYVTNSDSDIFLYIDNQQLYLVLSGRWYTAPHRTGPWTYVDPTALPEDFKRIPANGDKGDVLAHVPGTMQAQDAIADAAIPQTAAINRQQYDQPAVQYDGDPNFQTIEGSDLSYAVNTPASVIQYDRQYYCCYNGVWYQCGAPVGPWQICVHVPEPIYAIPPSCPLYSVTYCHVYGFTPDVCYVGYTPGYTGCYVRDGVVVYGTGYRYNAWQSDHIYVPRPQTFGFGAHYNPYSGHWGFGFALQFGGSSWVGTPDHSDERREHWFGYGGYRPTYGHADENHVRDTFLRNEIAARPAAPARPARDVYSRDIYQRRGDLRQDIIRPPTPDTIARDQAARDQAMRGEAARGDNRVDNGRGSQNGRGAPDNRGTPSDRGAQPDRNLPADNKGNGRPVNVAPAQNNVFTDHNGNIYRRSIDGWEVRDNAHNQWKPAGEAPAGAPPAASPQPPANGSPRGELPRGGTSTVPRVQPSENGTARDNAPVAGNQASPNEPARGGEAARGGETARGTETARGAETARSGEAVRGGEAARGNARGEPQQPAAAQPSAPVEPPRTVQPRGGTGAPRVEPAAPAPQAPPRDEPAHAAPAPSAPNSDLNKEYHARVAGDQRTQAYHQAPAPQPAAPEPSRPSAPPPKAANPPAEPAPAPAQPGGRRSGTRTP
jgi:hypothetical protein